MDKETVQVICEVFKVAIPLILILLSLCGFAHVNSDIHDLTTQVEDMDDNTIILQDDDSVSNDNGKGHLSEEEARDLKERLDLYLSD